MSKNAVQKMTRKFIMGLPVMELRAKLEDFFSQNQQGVLCLTAPTGSGKTYGIPTLTNDLGLKTLVLETARETVTEVSKNLSKALGVPVGHKVGGDDGDGIGEQLIQFATVGSGLGLLRNESYEPYKIVILDEYDQDNDGTFAQAHNACWQMLRAAKEQDQQFYVVLATATPDLVRAREFYGTGEFPYVGLESEGRTFNPQVIEVDVNSESAFSFGDFLPQYCSQLKKLIREQVIRPGMSVLCTLPSPSYFAQVAKLLEGQGIEISFAWSRSSRAEKQELYRPGKQSVVRIILATDLIRRGGTPHAEVAYPSGWQVRPFTTPGGVSGTREERSSEAEIKQDQGRVGRFQEGMVLAISDSKRPTAPLTFQERSDLAVFLMDILPFEDIRQFRWWGDAPQSLETCIARLKASGAARENEQGRLVLTQKGQVMRHLSGSLQMRATVLAAHKDGLLEEYLLSMADLSDLLVNTREDYSLRARQPMVAGDDFASVLMVWSVVAQASQGLSQEIQAEMLDITREVDRTHKEGHEKSLKPWEVDEQVQLLEASRGRRAEQAALTFIRKKCRNIARERGIFLKGVERALQDFIQAVNGLNKTLGKQENWHLSWAQVLEGFQYSEERSKRLTQLLVRQNPELIRVNVSRRGGLGDSFKTLTGYDSNTIFPGSSSFGRDSRRKQFCLGTPVPRKNTTYLEGVIMLDPRELIACFEGHSVEENWEVQYGEPYLDTYTETVLRKVSLFHQGDEVTHYLDEIEEVEVVQQAILKYIATTALVA